MLIRQKLLVALAYAGFVMGLVMKPPLALAHAHLEQATPPAGSTVSAAPSEATLVFSEDLEPKFSAAEVSDASGASVESSSTASGKTLRASLKPLVPGSYTVKWHVLSVDGHKTQGAFSFRVGK
jgi:copper resistance protein C